MYLIFFNISRFITSVHPVFCANCLRQLQAISFHKHTCCRPSPLRDCNSHVYDIGSSIGTVWRCRNALRLQPQTIDTDTQEWQLIVTVDGWQHCLLGRQRQLAVPAAHADPQSIAVFTRSYYLSLTPVLIQSTINTPVLILMSDFPLCYSVTEYTMLIWGQT